ncbi:MAG: D-alanine--D-alanine ligase family protein, partial [Spirochaetaceae bacterium]|nr:D-alanine--D-alanine ligase family protein [Spirochaetaceae bacterium]
TWLLQGTGAAAKARAGEGPLVISAGPRVFALPGSGLYAEGKAGLEKIACDLAFPVLHGSFGEDGTVQGFLEVAGLPYVGAPVLGSALGMDKEKAKELWLRAGLPVVPFVVVRPRDLSSSPDPEAALGRKIGARIGWPCFVKPARGGSSVGAGKATDQASLMAALRAAFEWDDKVLVEPFLTAREIECSVLGNDEPQAFPPGEILPTHEFYDYEAKYIDPEGAHFALPARLEEEQGERIRALAIAAYAACEMAGMARVDFFVDKRTGEILLNEINTIPGFTHISMYPKMCESGGLPYSELLSRLVELALERSAARASIRYSR